MRKENKRMGNRTRIWMHGLNEAKQMSTPNISIEIQTGTHFEFEFIPVRFCIR